MTTEQTQTIESPEEILGALAGDTPAPETPTEKIGEFDATQFAEALKIASGGKFADVATLNTAAEAMERVRTYEQKIQEYEANSKVSPFANDLVAKINDLLSQGGDLKAVERLVKLSAIDPQQMAGPDAIRMQLQMQNPDYTADEIDALIEQKLGFDIKEYNESEAAAAQRVALKTAQKEALAFLAEQRASAENPSARAAAEQRQQLVQQTVGVWNDVLPTIVEKFTVNVGFKDDAQGIDYNLAYNADAEAKQMAAAATMEAIKQYPEMFPANRDTLPKIQDLYQRYLVMEAWPKMAETLIRDAYSKAVEVAAQKNAGPPPTRPQTHLQQPPVQQNGTMPPGNKPGWI